MKRDIIKIIIQVALYALGLIAAYLGVSTMTSCSTFDSDAVSNETALDCGDESVTQQCFKDECDINILLAKFAVTGQLPENVRVPQYVDLRKRLIFIVR